MSRLVRIGTTDKQNQRSVKPCHLNVSFPSEVQHFKRDRFREWLLIDSSEISLPEGTILEIDLSNIIQEESHFINLYDMAVSWNNQISCQPPSPSVKTPSVIAISYHLYCYYR